MKRTCLATITTRAGLPMSARGSSARDAQHEKPSKRDLYYCQVHQLANHHSVGTPRSRNESSRRRGTRGSVRAARPRLDEDLPITWRCTKPIPRNGVPHRRVANPRAMRQEWWKTTNEPRRMSVDTGTALPRTGRAREATISVLGRVGQSESTQEPKRCPPAEGGPDRQTLPRLWRPMPTAISNAKSEPWAPCLATTLQQEPRQSASGTPLH